MHKKQQCLFTSVLSDFAPFLQLGKREIPLQHVKYQKFKSSETLKYHLKILFNLIKFLIYLSKKNAWKGQKRVSTLQKPINRHRALGGGWGGGGPNPFPLPQTSIVVPHTQIHVTENSDLSPWSKSHGTQLTQKIIWKNAS